MCVCVCVLLWMNRFQERSQLWLAWFTSTWPTGTSSTTSALRLFNTMKGFYDIHISASLREIGSIRSIWGHILSSSAFPWLLLVPYKTETLLQGLSGVHGCLGFLFLLLLHFGTHEPKYELCLCYSFIYVTLERLFRRVEPCFLFCEMCIAMPTLWS